MQRLSHQNVAGLLREFIACRSFSLLENAHQSKPINTHRVSPNNVSDRAQRSCVVINHHPDVAWPESYFGNSKIKTAGAEGLGSRQPFDAELSSLSSAHMYRGKKSTILTM